MKYYHASEELNLKDKEKEVAQTMEKIDETINDLCNWVQTESKKTGAWQETSILPEMVKALAELVSANAQIR